MYRRSTVRTSVQQFQSCFNSGRTIAPWEKCKCKERDNGTGIFGIGPWTSFEFGEKLWEWPSRKGLWLMTYYDILWPTIMEMYMILIMHKEPARSGWGSCVGPFGSSKLGPQWTTWALQALQWNMRRLESPAHIKFCHLEIEVGARKMLYYTDM